MTADPLAQDATFQRVEASGPRRVLRPGRNCWRIASARRASLLVDADAYFARLEQALQRAQRSILILGWDFDASIRLRPNGESPSMPLGDLLRNLVELRPELEVRILIWSLSTIHAPGATLPLLFGAPWQDHPRIHLRLDRKHPIYAAHHQKIVAIDDTVAFAGGIDLTVWRWDTTRHAADDPGRQRPDGTSYGPVHDMQMIVDAEAARAIADLAKQRWRDAIGEAVAAITPMDDLWPPGLEPDFKDVEVGIVRTAPRLGRRPAIREAAALTGDALKAAKRLVYIEAQYLTARSVRRRLLDILKKADGPEVVVIMTRSPNGLVEWFVMSANRDRLVRRLKRADRHGRLRVYYPAVPAAEGEREILVHAKLMIVDDALIRVGSANLNNRSVGLDTECDLAIEAGDDETRRSIARLLWRLLAEHLDAEPDEVAAALAATGSLIKAIERLNRNARGLRPMPAMTQDGPTWSIPGTRLFDPENHFSLLEFLRKHRLWPRDHAPAAPSALPQPAAAEALPRASESSAMANSKPPSASGTRK